MALWVCDGIVRSPSRVGQGHCLHPTWDKLEDAMLPAEPLTIVGADCRKGHHLIVEYSDGTTAVYSVEQLLELEPQQTIPADSKLTSTE